MLIILPCMMWFNLAGTFTGKIIRLISDIRLKHGNDAVNFDGCGRFVLADDLSDIADMTHIDLSGIKSLEGKFSLSIESVLPLWSILLTIIPCMIWLNLAGTFTGKIICLISNIRHKHGNDAVKLNGCGRFVLANNLSDIADITHIDLSNINSLEGKHKFSTSFIR